MPYIDVDQAGNNAIFVRKGIELNSFFKDLGAEGGDVIKSINGTPIDLDAIRPIIGQSFNWSPDTEITMTVQRGEQELTLSGKVGTPTAMVKTIVPNESATPEQLQLRKTWMKG
jgi:S1-C subfamily serine protease